MACKKIFVFVDNGTTGTIGAIPEDGKWSLYMPVPTYKRMGYAKKKPKNESHIDYDCLKSTFEMLMALGDLVIVTERPCINSNPIYFWTSLGAVKSYEILLAVLRTLGLKLLGTVDSRAWQGEALGDFEKGMSKEKSLEVGAEKFPEHAELIRKHGDADGLLGAWVMLARHKNGKNLLTGEKESGSMQKDGADVPPPKKARKKKETPK